MASCTARRGDNDARTTLVDRMERVRGETPDRPARSIDGGEVSLRLRVAALDEAKDLDVGRHALGMT